MVSLHIETARFKSPGHKNELCFFWDTLLNMEEATHIFHPSVDGNADLYCRLIVKREDKCLVHFLQLPGISDTWGVCFSNMEPGVAPEKTQNSIMCL